MERRSIQILFGEKTRKGNRHCLIKLKAFLSNAISFGEQIPRSDLMIFNFGSYTIDVDVEKTKKVYSELMTVSQNCNCDGCRNFEKYIGILPKAIISFFDTLGVD